MVLAYCLFEGSSTSLVLIQNGKDSAQIFNFIRFLLATHYFCKMSAKKRRPPHHHLAYKYFKRLQADKPLPEDEYHILNEKELARIKKVKVRATLQAGLCGAIAVLTYYIPLLLFPDFFAGFLSKFKLFGYDLEFNFLTFGFNILLVLIEVYLLTRINIWAVAETANASGFPDRRDPDYEQHVEQLFTVGLDSPDKQTLEFGIDPYEGTPKFYILLFTVFNLIKATLTNFVVKMITVKILARSGLRQYADLMGVPVFFIWNAFATWRIIEAAKIYIMAPGLIKEMGTKVSALHDDEDVRQNIYDAMQYIVTVKRSFHHNHFLLVKELIDVFELNDFKDKESDREAFLSKIKASKPEVKMAYSKLIVMGILIDGDISRREVKAMNYLYEEGIMNIEPSMAKVWCRDFRDGKGLDALINCEAES